jgi:hypothetical protein
VLACAFLRPERYAMPVPKRTQAAPLDSSPCPAAGYTCFAEAEGKTNLLSMDTIQRPWLLISKNLEWVSGFGWFAGH